MAEELQQALLWLTTRNDYNKIGKSHYYIVVAFPAQCCRTRDTDIRGFWRLFVLAARQTNECWLGSSQPERLEHFVQVELRPTNRLGC